MSKSEDLNHLKKNLSQRSTLDGMKKDMIEELDACGWNSTLSNDVQKIQSLSEKVLYRDLILAMCCQDVQDSLSKEQELSWEAATRKLVDSMTIPEDVKEKIFQKWKRRLMENEISLSR